MSRQTDRAFERATNKVEAAHIRVHLRIAARKEKGLTPLDASVVKNPYPKSKDRPVRVAGFTYEPNGKREVARRLRQAARGEILGLRRNRWS